MSQITIENRTYAKQCRACGEETTAAHIEHLCDWIEVCEHTIRQQRAQIAELQGELGTFRMKFKGGRNITTYGERENSEGEGQ